MATWTLDDLWFKLHTRDDSVGIPFYSLASFRRVESVTVQERERRRIPPQSMYSFGKLRETADKLLGDVDDGFTITIPAHDGRMIQRHVYDKASFEDLLLAVLDEVTGKKLDVSSSEFALSMIPYRPDDDCSLDDDDLAGEVDDLVIGIEGSEERSEDGSMRRAAEVHVSDKDNDDDEEDDDDDDLQYLRTEPVQHEVAEEGTEDQDMDIDEDDFEAKDGLIGRLRNINLIPKEKMRAFAWTFAMVEGDVNMQTEWHVPGMNAPANVMQCAFVYELGRRLRNDEDMQGIYNADGVGSGKTFTMLMLLVLRRLGALTERHLAANPGLHLSDRNANDGARCGYTKLLGIQCVCEKNSVLKVLVDRIPDSYSIVTAPRSVTSEWQREYTTFIKETFDEQIPFAHGQPVLHGYACREGNELVPLGRSPAASYGEFLLEPTDAWLSNTKDSAFLVRKGRGNATVWTYDMLLGRLEEAGRGETYRHKRGFGDDHRMSVIIIGREMFSRQVSKTLLSQSRKRELWIKEGRSKATKESVVNAFPFDPAVVICDEAHTYKGENNLNKGLRAYVERQVLSQGERPFLAFLSGTPATCGLHDLIPALSLIDRNASRHDTTSDAIKRVRRHLSKTDSPELKAALDDACEKVRVWMISRAPGSPMLDGQSIPRPHPPPVEIVKPFETPLRDRQSISDIVDKVRQGILERRMQIEPGTVGTDIATISHADILWKVGPLPGLQACLGIVEDFPYKGGEVEKDMERYDDANLRRSSAYLQHLELLTGRDSMFDEVARIVKMASRGKVADRPDREVSDEPLHTVLFAQHACSAAAAYVYLNEKCREEAEVVCLLSNTKPAARADILRRLRESSQRRLVGQRERSIVVVTTFKLVGVGLNDLVFCSLMIQLGEPGTEAELTQATGRIARPGQTKDTFRFHLLREGSESEELLRIRNSRRVAVCGDRLRQMRLFQGVDLLLGEN